MPNTPSSLTTRTLVPHPNTQAVLEARIADPTAFSPVVPQFFERRSPKHGRLGRLTEPHPEGRNVLLRKEVIQPHLPVRLPCYDFVPIASPTFDHSPPYGLGHGLRVLPTFVT